MSETINMENQRFGRLTVLYRNGSHNGRAVWHCKCCCGNEVDVLGKSLRQGNTTSCGCKSKDRPLKPNEHYIANDIVIMYTGNGERFIIDAEDYEKVKKYRWYKTNTGYIANRRNNALLHRMIMYCGNGHVVDHINHNKLDNRKANLRICTQADNSKNHILSKKNTSGTTGVCWSAKKGKYRAYICVDGKQKSLGYYSNIESAVLARKQAEEKHYKEFAPIGGLGA